MNILAGRKSGELDAQFGISRGPSEVAEWEQGQKPGSLAKLDTDLGAQLLEYRRVCEAPLLRKASQCFTLIWAMDVGGHVYIAYEELTVDALEHKVKDGSGEKQGVVLHRGYPRRRGATTHPVEHKKLGHPTLIGGGDARVAGELFLDFYQNRLSWFVNCSSGRYCRKVAPNEDQKGYVLELFKELLDNDVRWDDVDG